jgi:DNA-binding response OmpR family regulator
LLYVEDEDSLRTLVKSQLESEGFEVDTADDGDTGIEMIGKGSYEVILLDMRMPRVSGIDVLKHLRTKKSSSRVIVLTAVDDLSVAIEAVKNGANDYITKPYDLGSLLASIRRVLSK